MAAIDFPASPTNGQTFTPVTGITYRYVTPPGIWTTANGPVDTVIASDTPPSNPTPNQLWFNATLASLFVYYDDGNSAQWVPAMPIPAPVPPGSPAVRSKVTKFIANGTFTPDPLCVYGYAEAKGGGGGAETFTAMSAYFMGGAGGGEGARGIKFFVLADMAPTKVVTIGAGGAANTAGGTTSLGTLLIAEGGKAGGQVGQGGGGPGAHGGAGGSVVTGDIAIPGERGTNGILTSGGAGWGTGGIGGGSGGGAGAVTNNAAGVTYAGGNAFANSGGGGGGGASHTSGASVTGGAGGSGYVTIVEYLKA